MTNEQLYLAIGVPIVFNTALTIMMYVLLRASLTDLATSLRSEMATGFAAVNQRFDDMLVLWRSELTRVEEVLDARLKHLEESRGDR